MDSDNTEPEISAAAAEIDERKSAGDGLPPPLFPMRRRMALFIVSVFVGSVVLGSFLAEPWDLVGPGLWILAHLFAQAIVFRCPHCTKLAVSTPNGWSTPFVGDTCRWASKQLGVPELGSILASGLCGMALTVSAVGCS